MSEITSYHLRTDSKKVQVRNMFDGIAHQYDFLNHLFSLGIDKRWRKKAVKFLKHEYPKTILDVATGTADFAIEALTLNPQQVTGIDISEKMLEKGKIKIVKKKFENKIKLFIGDCENLSFADQSFDAVTVGFGVRNFENLEKGLSEIYRVLKKNGTLIILEFSTPQSFPIKQLYHFYFLNILPFFGRIISGHQNAYHYLPKSVKEFPAGKNFINKLTEAGFVNNKCNPVT
ncbi:MAG: bifunctional demethylmenaquinone methyltransferase/2-methoxy-6-polyprenyl-1,4-benzoquinol methylase UbiE, partial [Bacteroidia bacterium]